MAVTQGLYAEAIGRAGLAYADGVLYAVNQEIAGCVPEWGELFCDLKRIECAEWFYRMNDFNSDDSLYFYAAVLNIAGTKYSDATLDPNAQLPSTTIINNVTNTAIDYSYDQSDLVDAGGGNWYLPFLLPDGSGFANGATPIALKIVQGGITSYVFPAFDDSTVPARVYGFANNAPQTITLTVIVAGQSTTPVTNNAFTYTLPFNLA